MKKFIKIAVIVIVSIGLLHLVLGLLIESRFDGMINSDPDRKYNISYTDIDLNLTFDGLDATSSYRSNKMGEHPFQVMWKASALTV